MRAIRWAYGVTTVPERRDTLLPQTLRSLALAGFDSPRLFVDGCEPGDAWVQEHWLPITPHMPPLGAYGNWILALWELLIREPDAHRYALFQDDLVACRNLRHYLERCHYAERAYWNLYLFPHPYQQEPPRRFERGGYQHGWFSSNQKGRGALGLVFSRDAVCALLNHAHMVLKPISSHRPTSCIDGAVSEAMRDLRWTEYVHYPSLLQHTGTKSAIGNGQHQQTASFRGEDFDALSLLEVVHAG